MKLSSMLRWKILIMLLGVLAFHLNQWAEPTPEAGWTEVGETSRTWWHSSTLD